MDRLLRLPPENGGGACPPAATQRRRVPFRAWPRRLRAQFALGFAALGVVLAALMSLGLGAVVVTSSRHEAGMRLQGTAANAAQVLAAELFDRLREVQVLANSHSLWAEGLDSEALRHALVRAQAVTPRATWIGVVDANGLFAASVGAEQGGVPARGSAWFQKGLQAPHVSDVHAGAGTLTNQTPALDGGPPRYIDYAAPVAVDGKVIGVLAVQSRWDWTTAAIESLMPATQDRDGLEVFVFDRAGRMIYAPGASLPAHWQADQRVPVQPRTSEVQDGQHDARITPWRDGVDYLTTAVRVEARSTFTDLGWTVVVRQPLHLADAAARRGSAIALGLALLGAAITAAAGWCLAGRLARPLQSMARHASAVGGAGVAITLPAHGGSLEVEQLSAALIGMVNRLALANEDLEARVRGRTAELEAANAKLARLARFDPLTGLLNRRGYDEQVNAVVAAARRRGAPVSLVAIDADHFKRVNDDHGHGVGDAVLQAIADALRRRLREVDVLARVGGEEFVAVLPDTALAGAACVAGALLDAVAASPMPGIGRMTISCGVAELAVDRETPEAALKRADAALYDAKHAGRNRYGVAAPPAGPAPARAQAA